MLTDEVVVTARIRLRYLPAQDLGPVDGRTGRGNTCSQDLWVTTHVCYMRKFQGVSVCTTYLISVRLERISDAASVLNPEGGDGQPQPTRV